MARSGINKVILIGNLGQHPEVRYLASGVPVANFSIATSETWRDKATDEIREQTEWHRVVCYRRLAEIVGSYLKKGSKVYLEGKLRTRKWQDNAGNERTITEVQADELNILDGKKVSATARDGLFDSEKDGSPDTELGLKRSSENRGTEKNSIDVEFDHLEFDEELPF